METLGASTALMAALRSRDGDAVRRLVEAHPYLATSKDPDGMSVLMLTLYGRLGDATEALVAAGAVQTLHEAAALGAADMLEKVSGDVDGRSPDGFTPLHLAVHFGHAALVQPLVARGADVDALSTNPMQNTPLHAAAAGGSVSAVRALIDAGATLEVRDSGGHTPLHVAAANGFDAIIVALLDAGCDISAKNDTGQTAADLARSRDEDDTVALLAQRASMTGPA